MNLTVALAVLSFVLLVALVFVIFQKRPPKKRRPENRRKDNATVTPEKLGDGGRDTGPESGSPEATAIQAPDVEQPVAGEHELVIRDTLDEVLIQIEAASKEGKSDAHENGQEVSNQIARYIGPLIERTPSFVNTARDLTAESYRLVLKPKLLKGIQDGSLEVMKSSRLEGALRSNIVEKGTQQIAGQGNLVPTGKVVRLASAGFQVASFVTGQAHLAQINKRLEELSKGVSAVKKHLENQQEGELIGKIRYLHKTADQLHKGSLVDVDTVTVNIQLETIERESLEVGAAIEKELEQHFKAYGRIDLNKMMASARNDAIKLGNHSKNHASILRRYQLVLWVRLITAELKAMLPVDQHVVEIRRAEIKQDLKEFEALCQEHSKQFLERTNKVTGLIIRTVDGKGLHKIRRKARTRIQNNFEPAKEAIDQMRQTIENGTSLIEERKENLDSGLVLSVKRLKDGSIKAQLADD